MTRRNPLPSTFLPLHPLEFRILMILLGGPSHGYAVVQEIEGKEGRAGKVYPANLYRRIRDLLSRGLIHEVSLPEGDTSDSRRRYFGLTDLGQKVVEAEAQRLKTLLAEAQDRGLLSPAG